MPIYEYACDCNDEIFEVLRRASDNSPVQCPACLSSSKLELIPSSFATRNTAIHTSERPVIFRNPKTGEIRYPATKDAPLHPKYAAQGYVRQEAFNTFNERDAFERKTGKLHERSHYDPGSATAEQDMTPPDPAANLAKYRKTRIRARV